LYEKCIRREIVILIKQVHKLQPYLFETITISYAIEVTGEYNIYTWYKDGTLMPNQTTNTLYIENATINDQGVYVLKVNNTYIPDLELVSYDYMVSIYTEIFDTEISIFKLYPNPANGDILNVIVDNPEIIDRIMIMNGSGQILKTEKINSQNNMLNIGTLNTGIYFVKVIYENGEYQVEKLVIK
ncbi:MAG: T9SS type A sorting domain-containing protein, partial [Bacteroidales bacterium]|nr:T9SS type A sorting domain-containing protein [Bacteroidales bacterium]